MKKNVTINANPRTVWNAATLVREAVKDTESEGAQEKQKAFSPIAEMAGNSWDN